MRCSNESKARFYVDKSIFLIKTMISRDAPKHEMEDAVKAIKDTLSESYHLLGEDFCIEKGRELEQIWQDYMDYSMGFSGDSL